MAGLNRVFTDQAGGAAAPSGSALFQDKDATVGAMLRDRLVTAAKGRIPAGVLTEDYVWEKLLVAEAEVAMRLRVRLQPTAFFPSQPSAEQLAELGDMPWDIDTGYDYEPSMYTGDRWGFIQTHHKPVVEVSEVKFAYPATGGDFVIPDEWLQVNGKYGQVQIVPLSHASVGIGAYFLQLISSGRTIPNMVRITYVAGLVDAARKWPHLVDTVKKMAALKILEDCYLPQSASISADGLSQSMSIDMGKYEDLIAGSIDSLRDAIHGIRVAVF